MNRVNKFHFIYGLVGLVLFALSGQYMHHVHNHLEDMADGPRLLFRSAHIYFLLASIINIVFGFYFRPSEHHLAKYLEYLLSMLLIVAPIFIAISFFKDSLVVNLDRGFIYWGMYALLGVPIIIVIVGLLKLRPEFLKRD